MKKRDIGRSILTAMILLLASVPVFAGSLKTGSLEQKIYEISALRAKIIDKIDQAIEIRTRLEQRFDELRVEIRAEQTRFEIYSYQQALQNLRIRYNLSLIRVIRAYTNRLNERIDYFQTGNERLRFLIQQINDDIAIINTLEDMEIENLINRIDRLLNEFIPETQKQIFDAADIHAVPMERIWDEIDMNSAEKNAIPAHQLRKG
jgi:phosphoglycerate-specific signal transduction histidine kinase